MRHAQLALLPRSTAEPASLRHADSPRAPALRGLLHQIFEASVDAHPDHVAVLWGREPTTYRELDARANRIARYLRSRGVRRGSLVALDLPRSADAYAAILGILKSGAAYVPLDPDYPSARVRYILKDCRPSALVTIEKLTAQLEGFDGELVRLDVDEGSIERQSPARLARHEVGVETGDLCYVIYTSGSTGHPKGVMIEHQSACHLVRAEGCAFDVHPGDRVYQGFSLAFDASVEEIWLAFRSGATLVAATPAMMRAGPDLSRVLTERGVSVLSCVPTLLSMLVDEIPTLRLLILGGETCPDHLVERWSRPGCRMVNTYGPTETTVIATYDDLVPGKPVTIGHPVPGYRIHLLDGDLRPIPVGDVGEIFIGGPGVARGYVGLPEQTPASFLPDPFAPASEPGARLYRSGDLGRLDAEGRLEFLGRMDSQIKIRGFRVEPAEVESALMSCEGVQTAACIILGDPPDDPRLVGYVVSRSGETIDEDRLRERLKGRLPGYMMPARLEIVPDLPRLPSGKLDRASLPDPGGVSGSRSSGRLPRSRAERRIARVWETLLQRSPITVQEDFFDDLGGHSLLAARMVSELRKDPRFRRLSMAHVYAHPTIASLAALDDVASRRPRNARGASRETAGEGEHRGIDPRRHFLAGILQAVGLYFGFGFRGAQWVTPYLVFVVLTETGHSALASAGWAFASAAAVFPILTLTAIAVKWIVLGRIQPGRHPLWGVYYLRFWFVRSLVSALPLERVCGTPLMPFLARLFGAHIGRDVHLETAQLAAFDLVFVGDDSSIDDSVSILACTVENEELVLGRIQVGRGCHIGARSVLREETTMEDGARLEDLSLLPRGERVPAGETWTGSPARPAAGPGRTPGPPPSRGPIRRIAIVALYALLVAILPLAPLLAFVPGIALLFGLAPLSQPLLYLAAVPLVGASFVVLLTAGFALVKWTLVGRVRSGTYRVHGGFYIRKWIVDQLLAMSLDVVGSLYATLYLVPWFRALGARVGRFVELSTVTTATPDLLEIGEGGTVADEASLGAARVEGGWMTLGVVRLGERAFVGNGAVVPAGIQLGDRSLVGVLSLAPVNPVDAAEPDASWLGSPPIHLPRRQTSTPFPVKTTYRPTRGLRWARGSFEILRVTLPAAGFILVTSAVLKAAIVLRDLVGFGGMLALLPLVYAGACAALALAVAALKWIVVGRFRPFEHPQWSWFVWRLELVNALYEFMVTPLALDPLQGTPFLPWYFRLLGARIGRRTCFRTTGLIEFDLVDVGDEAVANEDCVLQAHLFEDRILKASHVLIGRGCEVGAGSVVLYDTEMEDGSRLDALSLLMKGESLPGGTSWVGIPAVRRSRRGYGGDTSESDRARAEQRHAPSAA